MGCWWWLAVCLEALRALTSTHASAFQRRRLRTHVVQFACKSSWFLLGHWGCNVPPASQPRKQVTSGVGSHAGWATHPNHDTGFRHHRRTLAHCALHLLEVSVAETCHLFCFSVRRTEKCAALCCPCQFNRTPPMPLGPGPDR